jgi:hypothetical protein
MTTKRLPKADPVNHIIVGFAFPNRDNPQETVSGTTRHGIWLGVSSQIYTQIIAEEISKKGIGSLNPQELADTAFKLTEVYLEKMDHEVARKNPKP